MYILANIPIFAFCSFLVSNLWGPELALYNAAWMTAGFVASYVTVINIGNLKFPRMVFLYPLLICAIAFAIFFGCREIYIPIFTPMSHYLGQTFPMGHFGFSALFIFFGLTVFLTVLIVHLLSLALRACISFNRSL
jgi:hypothetical protein